MDKSLEGRCALVTGAVKGIGKGIALALAGSGVKLALPYWDWEEHLPALVSDLKAAGANYFIKKADLRNPGSVECLVEDTVSELGRIDIVINNIERGGWPVVHGPYVKEQWDLEMETTLRAKRWVYNAALPHLKESGDGCVVNISSIAGIVGRSGPASLVFNDGYSAANRGVSMLTEIWAREAAPEVRVNELVLGFIHSRHGEGTRGWGVLQDDQKKAIIRHTLLGRIGEIQDVVSAVMFLVRDADYMTGSVIRLDGGYVLGGEPVTPMPPGVL